MIGAGRLAWQRGPRALYAEVTVECAPGEAGGGATTLPADIEPSWAEGARFGVALFREAFAKHAGAEVRVQRVRGQIVDTTVTAVAYATFHALAMLSTSRRGTGSCSTMRPAA